MASFRTAHFRNAHTSPRRESAAARSTDHPPVMYVPKSQVRRFSIASRRAGLSGRTFLASDDAAARIADGFASTNAAQHGLRAPGHQAGELLRGKASCVKLSSRGMLYTSDLQHLNM